MQHKIPKGKLRRSAIGGKTALQVGGRIAGYMAKKPFLSEQGRQQAREKLEQANAQTVFACLSLLKGTALKIAQALSMELDVLPEAICVELRKSYNQVPPMNRVLAAKAVANALGRSPSEVFESFEPAAFAAASLGQVHRAVLHDGRVMAVKLQYPGINRTIEDDLKLARGIVAALPDFALIGPILDEIEARLLEEIDYESEAGNMVYFRENLGVEGVVVPEPWAPGCSGTILSATHMGGQPLNQWLETAPSLGDRQLVAERLNAIFLKSFYEMGRIHADPNPGNYIVMPDLSVALVDFGCVKSFDPAFVEDYRRLIRIIPKGRKREYFELLRSMQFIKGGLDEATESAIFEVAYGVGQWLGRMFESETFDFGGQADFIAEGRELTHAMFRFRRHFTANPEFVFLDRTRYGLLRILERLGCPVRLRNAYECEG